MKAILCLLMLIPIVTVAQDTSNDSQHIKIHFRKIVLKQDGVTMTNFTRPGDLSLRDSNCIAVSGPLNIDRPDLSRPIHNNEWLIRATNVEITDPERNGALKGDELRYNNNTKQGTLTGHVTLAGKGIEEKLGKTAKIDFSDNHFRIVSVQ